MECWLATKEDIVHIMPLIQQAKAYLKSKGIDQWQKEYPAAVDIEADIAGGR